MPDLSFQVEKAEPVPYAAAPLLNFKLRVTQTAVEEAALVPVHSVVLRCQIRIEPAQRRYEVPEQERLLDLFGEPERWGQTLRSMLWTHSMVIVPPFAESTVVEIPVSCSSDLNVAAAKFFYALAEGEIPLCFLFSGTVFYEADTGRLQVTQIPWEKEATFRLPVRVWRQIMDLYYPNMAWLCLRKDVFDRLYRYKSQRGLPTWEQVLDSLLSAADKQVPP